MVSEKQIELDKSAISTLSSFLSMSTMMFSLAYIGHYAMQKYADYRIKSAAAINNSSSSSGTGIKDTILRILDFMFVGIIEQTNPQAHAASGAGSEKEKSDATNDSTKANDGKQDGSHASVAPAKTDKAATDTTNDAEDGESPSKKQRAKLISLIFCTFGLQISYLMWGVMQEQLMTSTYGGEHFPSSSILVLSNRWVAIVFAVVAVYTSKQPPHRAPAIEYSFASVSNVLSSYCQYEALRFVSFPVQTVCKASKVIPVMIMGTFIHRKFYSLKDYVSALIITFGVSSFGLIQGGYNLESLFLSSPSSTGATASSSNPHGHSTIIQQLFGFSENVSPSSITGGILLLSYLALDSFTSNWQSHLLQEHKLSAYQVMLGINIFSTFFSMASLIQNGELVPGMVFLAHHPDALTHTLLMSFCGAVGQMFIYKTIAEHGPIVFNIISVTRQLLSIVISAIIFGHAISVQAWIAVFITFGGILYRNLGSSGKGGGGSGKKQKL